ncbi:cyclase family protein [Anaerotignum sp.]|uniref:cyclase family protein n=1 Tax=Anaerotignum sp. TaxID=2039241 RepID=UPI0028AF4DB9|nr:cyclase family protein [Anaerotignum sp.]
MLIDVTLKMTSKMFVEVISSATQFFPGHIGTHFDSTNQEFPLEYMERQGIVFDISNIEGREVIASDIDLSLVEEGMFVAFCSNYSETVGYGSHEYFNKSPKISFDILNELLKRNVCIVGLDFVRSSKCRLRRLVKKFSLEQEPYVIENLCNLKTILNGKKVAFFKACTFPMYYEGFTGNPCRVVARIEKE